MARPLVLFLCLCLTLAGCARLSGSRLNPLNWFGASVAVAPTDAAGDLRPLVPAARQVTATDARILIASVTALDIDRTTGGAIIRATGIARSQGAFNAQLVPVGQDNGTLTLEFRIETPPPAQPEAQSGAGPASRTITVARVIDAAELASVRRVVVIGADGGRSISR